MDKTQVTTNSRAAAAHKIQSLLLNTFTAPFRYYCNAGRLETAIFGRLLMCEGFTRTLVNRVYSFFQNQASGSVEWS